MAQQALSLSILVLSFMFFGLSISTANSNVYVQCSQLNFTPMTPYESNVISLFTSFDDSSSLYIFNTFEISIQSDGVYGLFQCRGDLNSSNCKNCVINASRQLKTTCPTSIGGEIQLEGCFVKYDDTSFFGVQDKMEVRRICGPSIDNNYDVLKRIDDALTYLVGGNGQYFRGGDFGSVQGVAQCVQDLSLIDCQDCLAEASGRLRSECETSTWADMYMGKCYIRYADQRDLNPGNDSDNSDDNDNPNNNDNSNSHKKRRKGRKINFGSLILSSVSSFVGGFLGGVSLSVVFAFNCGNMKFIKTYKGMTEELERSKEVTALAIAEAKLAKVKAENAEKIAKELAAKIKKLTGIKEVTPSPCSCPPMPPPCYLPTPPPCRFVVHSSPDRCSYL